MSEIEAEDVAPRGGETPDPARERELLEEAAHHRELEVGVHVDQPGAQDHVAQLDIRAVRGRRDSVDLGEGGRGGRHLVAADLPTGAAGDVDHPLSRRHAVDGAEGDLAVGGGLEDVHHVKRAVRPGRQCAGGGERRLAGGEASTCEAGLSLARFY